MIPRVVHADAIVPGDDHFLRDGALVLDADGTILDLGPLSDILPRHRGAAVERVHGVVLPGLVNAHAHIELSLLRGKVAGGAGFVPWVERLVGLRGAEQPERDEASIERAAAELEAFGTVAIGDVSNTLAGVFALARHGIGGIVFHELFGMDAETCQARLSAMRDDAERFEREWPSPDLAYTLAPHTVYTTHPDAVRAIVRSVRERGARTTVHLAEHAAERTFLLRGEGPFFDFATRLKVPVASFPIPHRSPVQTAADLGLLAPDVLLVHLTDARAEEIDTVAASGAPVVLCPRSNLFIELKLPPLTAMLERGIVPALGTDSLASNLSLDVLAEAKALAERFPGVKKETLLTMATSAGARALGRSDLGRLAKGLRPGVLAVTGQLADGENPCEFVFQKPPAARRWIARRKLVDGGRGSPSTGTDVERPFT
jgi:aminodeoxyfutalosine deaminase